MSVSLHLKFVDALGLHVAVSFAAAGRALGVSRSQYKEIIEAGAPLGKSVARRLAERGVLVLQLPGPDGSMELILARSLAELACEIEALRSR